MMTHLAGSYPARRRFSFPSSLRGNNEVLVSRTAFPIHPVVPNVLCLSVADLHDDDNAHISEVWNRMNLNRIKDKKERQRAYYARVKARTGRVLKRLTAPHESCLVVPNEYGHPGIAFSRTLLRDENGNVVLDEFGGVKYVPMQETK